MKKRILALVLGAAMTLSMVGCGAKGGDDAKTDAKKVAETTIMNLKSS